jgi:hypothetical protein
MITERFVKVSKFSEFFRLINTFEDSQFYSWVFLQDMLYGASLKWWGDCQARTGSHEGLDFCLFQDKEGHLYHFTGDVQIPAMYAGTIVSIIPDFLGQTVIIEHKAHDDQGHFLTIYGHLIPREGLEIGTVLSEGDRLGTVSVPRNSLTGLLPHVHVSIAGVLGDVAYSTLNWDQIVSSVDLALVDPLDLLDGPQLVIKRHESKDISIRPIFINKS